MIDDSQKEDVIEKITYLRAVFLEIASEEIEGLDMATSFGILYTTICKITADLYLPIPGKNDNHIQEFISRISNAVENEINKNFSRDEYKSLWGKFMREAKEEAI